MRIVYGLLLISLMFLLGCNSAQKAYERGKYDLAIKKSVKKLKKDSNDPKHLRILEESFNAAVTIDQDRIALLQQENSTAAAAEIVNRYNSLNQRQAIVKQSPEIPGGIKFENYEEKLKGAKEGAAEKYYQTGEEQLKGDRFEARNAYSSFNAAEQYLSGYKDAKQKMEIAKDKGVTLVKIGFFNSSKTVNLPEELLKHTEIDNLAEFNDTWITYDYSFKNKDTSHYLIDIVLEQINVTPEQSRERTYRESKKVKDGWQYKVDDNGRFVTDTAGQKIKEDKFKTIFCDITEQVSTKSATLSGKVSYFEVGKDAPIASIPYEVSEVYEHVFVTASGDLAAVSEATKAKMGTKPQAFPTGISLIARASEKLVPSWKKILQENKKLIR